MPGAPAASPRAGAPSASPRGGMCGAPPMIKGQSSGRAAAMPPLLTAQSSVGGGSPSSQRPLPPLPQLYIDGQLVGGLELMRVLNDNQRTHRR